MSTDPPVPSAADRRTAWTFVAVQFLLLGVVVLAPRGDAWPVGPALSWTLTALTAAALVLMLVAGLGLGRGLTAAPLPNEHARLRTGGLYRWVRHPIYSGLLLFALARAAASGQVASAVAAGLLVLFISAKARWEEGKLAERFAGYPQYAARTPRFVPLPFRR